MFLKVGIIGVGTMGSCHLNNILNKLVDNVKITALCDIDKEQLNNCKDKVSEDVALFDNASELINSGLVDGVIIATPHYFHPTIAIEAFNAGLHVFCEKPAGVFTKNVLEMNNASKLAGTVFAVNFVLRATESFKKIKLLIDNGEIGDLRRLTWIITNWYRTSEYYRSGGWRATWAGEGGGTLLNQNPHQLDLIQWLTGMPKRIRGFCYFGKRRNIEVEDEATIYMEYENGMTATYITSVTEFPGSNRLEIVGNKGKIVYENEKITLYKTNVTEEEFDKETSSVAGPIPMEIQEFDCAFNVAECQAKMLKNWADAALFGTPLYSSGIEGINSLTISNAAYLSQWKDKWIELPINADEYLCELNKRIETSTFKKEKTVKKHLDINQTFTK